MREITAKAAKRLERILYRRGFANPEVRRLVAIQLILSAGASLVFLVVTLASKWSLSFGAGALLISLNFWSMAKVAQQLVYARRGGVFTLLTLFYIRLILTGLVLYALIGWFGASVSGILAGVTTVVATAVTFGATTVRNRHLENKVKEA